MYYDDHNPPHFHAMYNNTNAIIDINHIQVIKGFLPSKQLKLVLAWCVIHQDELLENWRLAKENMKLNKIDPLM